MPRNGSGTYSLPQPPFVAGTTISSAAMNSDLSDIASALTGSLPRDGQAGMLGQFKATDGSAAAPSITFTNDSTTGFLRNGANQIGVSVGGVLAGIIGTTGFQNVNGIYVGCPVGMLVPFAGSSAPTGWLFANGASLLRASYPLLYAAIGTTYGAADGTHFNVPDMRNFVPVGQDNMGGAGTRGLVTSAYFGTNPAVIGNVGGLQTITMARANLPNVTLSGTTGDDSPDHTHTVFNVSQITGAGGSTYQGYSSGSSSNIINTNIGSGGASNRHQHPFTTSSLNGGVAQTSMANIQPGIIVPYIIFAGA